MRHHDRLNYPAATTMRFTPPLIRFALLLALAPSLLLAQAPAPASAVPEPETPADAQPVRDPALYQAEVELHSQGAGERRAATARALALVLVKLTGQPNATSNPVVRRAMAKADAMVVDSNRSETVSDQQGNTAVGGAPVYKTLMTVAFDPASVDALIAGAGLPYWGGARPRPLLWLAIDDGRGARLVNSQQLAVVKPLATRGLERGLRFGLPSGTAIEQAAVQTIWAQSLAPMLPLASRYGEQTQLLGRVYRSGTSWTADWVLGAGETELARWSFTDPSPQRAIASGADGAADAIARRDARALDMGQPGTLVVTIAGLRDSDDYMRAMGYLQTLAVVRSVTVLEATPEQLSLSLELAVGPEGFARFVGTGGTLEADPLASPDAPRYLLRQ
jgi:hypothetical protein